MHILTDADIERLVTPELARTAMREALVAAWHHQLIAPPRLATNLTDRRLTFTCGAHRGDWFGYRSYVAPGGASADQVVVVQDEATEAVRGIAVGRALGPRRVGGIGAVALDVLGPQAPTSIAVIGAGNQAWHQLWALPPRFRTVPVSVYARTPATREDFAARARAELGLDATAATTLEGAVRNADVVILATNSGRPVIGPDLVCTGALVTTLGPKQHGRAEFEPSLARDAALVVTDSPEQVRAYDPPNVLAGTPAETSLRHLGAIVAGKQEVPAGTKVFFSVGLAGTEAWLLDAALRHLPPSDISHLPDVE